jgi:serine phosphatase RsbU (regulator of sigma subunit)
VNKEKQARLLKQEMVYIALSAVVWAVFWAEGRPVNPVTILIYTMCIGNLLSISLPWFGPLYEKRAFPYDLLIFLPVLAVVLVPVFLVTTVIVWLVAPHGPLTLTQLLMAWKFPAVIAFIFGIFLFLSQRTKERLERRNVELEQAVESGTAQIAMQEQELERAREIQSSLLPKEIPQLAGYEIAGAWQPALTVSGDYYDVLRLDGHRLGICIADVAGKGVSAALLMANVQAAVRAFAGGSESPAEMCRRVNALLHENVAIGKFVTFIYGILDAEKRTFRYCNAGHLPPIVFSNGEARILDGGGAVLGVFPSWDYEDMAIELIAGDRLLLFTDGITEAANASGREFGETGIAEFVKANGALSAKDLNGRLLRQVTEFCDAQFHDDATALVIAAL